MVSKGKKIKQGNDHVDIYEKRDTHMNITKVLNILKKTE
jgi:hypothetical protein